MIVSVTFVVVMATARSARGAARGVVVVGVVARLVVVVVVVVVRGGMAGGAVLLVRVGVSAMTVVAGRPSPLAGARMTMLVMGLPSTRVVPPHGLILPSFPRIVA
jgi:hypothetical protein